MFQSDDLRTLLLQARTKKEIAGLAGEVSKDSKSFAVLMDLFFQGPYRTTHFAGHVLAACCEIRPDLMMPYLDRMLEVLPLEVHDSLKRNVVRTLQFIDIPEEYWDKALNYCFQLLQSKKEAVAIKVFSMTVLGKLSKKIPEIRNELRVVIEDQMPFESAAFVSRGRKTLKMLH